MPNGALKNWVRLCAAIDGFRLKYHQWPTQVRMTEAQIDDIKSVFKPETYKKFESRIRLIAVEEITVTAEDEKGRQYDYAKSGFPKRKPRIDAASWLGVEPDIPARDVEIVIDCEPPSGT